jgi:hypothetical protein
MRGVELHGLEIVVVFVAIALVISSFGVRVYLFHKLKGDDSVRDLLEDASAVGSDFLVLKFLSRWRSLSSEATGLVLVFSVMQIFGVFLLLCVGLLVLVSRL